MAWNGRRERESDHPPDPELKRPSNPRAVAKATPAAARTGAPKRGGKKVAAKKPRPALPASVTMGATRVLRGEKAAELGATRKRWGVLYRLLVRDANGKPIDTGAYVIRKHLLPMESSGCFARGPGALIEEVELDGDGGAYDFAGVSVAGANGDGEDRTFEYFSFEMAGLTYAIPQSGFVVTRARRGREIEVTRTPQAGGSVHGAVVQGLMVDGGDAWSVDIAPAWAR